MPLFAVRTGFELEPNLNRKFSSGFSKLVNLNRSSDKVQEASAAAHHDEDDDPDMSGLYDEDSNDEGSPVRGRGRVRRLSDKQIQLLEEMKEAESRKAEKHKKAAKAAKKKELLAAGKEPDDEREPRQDDTFTSRTVESRPTTLKKKSLAQRDSRVPPPPKFPSSDWHQISPRRVASSSRRPEDDYQNRDVRDSHTHSQDFRDERHHPRSQSPVRFRGRNLAPRTRSPSPHQSFTTNFRMRNAQLFSGTSWVELDDLRAWLRERDDIDLLELDSISSFDPRLMDGVGVSIQSATFHGYPGVGFDDTRSTTPSSGCSHPYDDYQSSNYSVPASELDYLDASGSSTPYSGLDLFGDSSGSNLDWNPSLAAFFDSAEVSDFAADANQLPDNLSFAAPLSFNSGTSFAPGICSLAAVASGSGTSFFPQHTALSHLQAADPAPVATGTSAHIFTNGTAPSYLQAPDPAPFLFPPEDFKFEDGNPSLMTQEEMDAAGEAWQWVRSDTVWLDEDVWSEVYIPPYPFPITKNQKVRRIERVHGIPSQFPVPRVATAYLVNFSSSRDAYTGDDGEVSKLDKILKEKVCSSSRDAYGLSTLPGLSFLGWNSRHVNTVKGMKCTAKNASGGACGGYQVLKEAARELPSGRKFYFACSNYSSSWKNHSGIQIPPDVDEDLCIRAFRGESITDCSSGDPTAESCSRIIGSGSGKKGKSQCPFPHLKDGKSYVAPMCKLVCSARIIFFVPLDEENIPLVVVLPEPSRPHTHPPPPATKVPTHVKLLYEKAIRAFGVSIATVNKVEQALAQSTIQIMGAAPGLVHPSLLQASTKQGIISALKRREPGGDKSGWEGLFDLYRAEQVKEPRERYMHSFDFLPGRSPPSAVITTFDNFLLSCVKHVRSIDQDTTFKRMKAGLLNEYELTAFFSALNRLFTFGRIYMDAKDADAFEFAWDKVDEVFYGATGKHLAFKAWDPEGWLVSISGDMEAAPWIGMARSFIKRMDSDKRPTVDEFLAKVLRVCRRHAIEGLKKSVKPHLDESQFHRFQRVLNLKTRGEVDDFSSYVFSLNIPPITAWWNHKLNHKWILPGLIECLSGLSHEEWMTTPFTSNGNETQHHWTNLQTGIGLPARECILRAKDADQAVGRQFEQSLASGVMTNNRNELSHRTSRNAKRHTSAVEKAKLASASNSKIKELRAELAILVAESKKSKSKSIAQAATRTNPLKRKIPAAGELDGILMSSPEESEAHDQDEQDESVFALDTTDDNSLVISADNVDVVGPPVESGENFHQLMRAENLKAMFIVAPSAPSVDPPVAPAAPSVDPPRPNSPARSTNRRSSRKRGASNSHEDAPAPKSKKTQAAIAPEASTSVKKRTRKVKPWSVRHTDDIIYTSFEFLAQFPDEYRALYGDTLPA
ncbi:hypothetical protein B0H15DRAFT_805590 [Mycena belliarum]|uniref:Uncharacterized protein n=1 Tax=Mycena belliarum TaxID=1033014 RepID=A0AAD6TWB2_9AGAR|nr:hypothetical protein B0H15DRAFT_805590 [Mycena belliae]